MKRRRGREYVLQFLYQIDFTGRRPEREEFYKFWEGKNEDAEVREFTEDIVNGTLNHLQEIDSALGAATEHWVIERMAAVDRNILRGAIYELFYRLDIPSTVTINEAIEIAKKYSAHESAFFINGILDNIAKGIKGRRAR
jgi:transcription antitermination protein NusB